MVLHLLGDASRAQHSTTTTTSSGRIDARIGERLLVRRRWAVELLEARVAVAVELGAVGELLVGARGRLAQHVILAGAGRVVEDAVVVVGLIAEWRRRRRSGDGEVGNARRLCLLVFGRRCRRRGGGGAGGVGENGGGLVEVGEVGVDAVVLDAHGLLEHVGGDEDAPLARSQVHHVRVEVGRAELNAHHVHVGAEHRLVLAAAGLRATLLLLLLTLLVVAEEVQLHALAVGIGQRQQVVERTRVRRACVVGAATPARHHAAHQLLVVAVTCCRCCCR